MHRIKPFQSFLAVEVDPRIAPRRHDARSRILRIVLGMAFISSLGFGTFLFFWCQSIGLFALDKAKIANLDRFEYQDNSIVFDKNGNKIGEYFDEYHLFVHYDELPHAFVDALIATEDRRFFEHSGVDYRGILRAIWTKIKLRKASGGGGASTITQQVVRSVFLNNKKNISRKVTEIAYALELERTMSKQKILEFYVNTMFLGNGSYGVGAAAKRYFGKKIQDLSPAQSAMIAGLFQSPSRYNPKKYPDRAKSRQLKVINSMLRNKMITKKVAQELSGAPLNYREYKYLNAQNASWFVDYVRENIPKLISIKRSGIGSQGISGYRIYTTLDSDLQTLAESSVHAYDSRLNELSRQTGMIRDSATGGLKKSRVEASMLVTDPNTGDVLAMVGGRDFKRSQYNRASSAMRSPGSAFKPIVFTEALLAGSKWSDLLYVSPINIANYRPKSEEADYLTETTLLRAFYRSMNAPALDLAESVGMPAIISRAKTMGVTSPIKDEFGSAIGSSDVSMMDLSRMYGTFATGGVLTEINPITKITDANGQVLWERPTLALRQKRVLNQQVAYLMTQGMMAVLAKGTGSSSKDLSGISAGKTGTSNDNADNWFCGYTPNLVSIVWVGTDEHTAIHANISGGAIALPIWDQFIRGSLRTRRAPKFVRPSGIVDADINPIYGHLSESGIKMSFIEQNVPMESTSPLEHLENDSSGGFRHAFNN